MVMSEFSSRKFVEVVRGRSNKIEPLGFVETRHHIFAICYFNMEPDVNGLIDLLSTQLCIRVAHLSCDESQRLQSTGFIYMPPWCTTQVTMHSNPPQKKCVACCTDIYASGNRK